MEANKSLCTGKLATLDTLDRVLHHERMTTLQRPSVPMRMRDLPDGTFFRMGGSTYLSLRGAAVQWAQGEYIGVVTPPETADIQVLTPPSIVTLYASGWKPTVSNVAVALMTQTAVSSG